MLERERVLCERLLHKKRDDGIWRPEDDARLNPSKARTQKEPEGDLECVHCHQSFFAYQSSAADFGLCDYCLHSGD